MIKSPYATKFTQEQMAGKKDPQRDPTNNKAVQEPRRRKIWEQRQKANGDK